MKYTLYHKIIPVLVTDFDIDTNLFKNVDTILSEKHVPTGLVSYADTYHKPLSDALNLWWKSRIIPKNRLTDKITGSSLSLFEKSFGFNLSDHYWINPTNSDMTWEKGNFFHNGFDEDLGKYVIGHINNLNCESLDAQTPDLFSNGEQDKRWVIENGKRFLLKYGKLPYCQEPFNERLASEICKRLGFSYVPYSFKVKKNPEVEIYSVCPCFINENTEYIPAAFIQYVQKKESNESSYSHLLHCCETLQMPDINRIKEQFAQMVLLDYITANTDRHFGNFGFIRNAETLEWKGLAPNFDTGNSMFFEFPTSDLRKSNSFMENVKCKSFATNQNDQLKRFSTSIAELNINFEKLSGIDLFYSNILSLNPKFDSERTHLLCTLLNKRIVNAKEIVLTRNDVTQNYLNEITVLKSTNSQLSFKDRIGFAYKNICGHDKIKQKIVSDFLTTLKPSSEDDLENKVRNYIAARKHSTTSIDINKTTQNNNRER